MVKCKVPHHCLGLSALIPEILPRNRRCRQWWQLLVLKIWFLIFGFCILCGTPCMEPQPVFTCVLNQKSFRHVFPPPLFVFPYNISVIYALMLILTTPTSCCHHQFRDLFGIELLFMVDLTICFLLFVYFFRCGPFTFNLEHVHWGFLPASPRIPHVPPAPQPGAISQVEPHFFTMFP